MVPVAGGVDPLTRGWILFQSSNLNVSDVCGNKTVSCFTNDSQGKN